MLFSNQLYHKKGTGKTRSPPIIRQQYSGNENDNNKKDSQQHHLGVQIKESEKANPQDTIQDSVGDQTYVNSVDDTENQNRDTT